MSKKGKLMCNTGEEDLRKGEGPKEGLKKEHSPLPFHRFDSSVSPHLSSLNPTICKMWER